MDNSNAIPFIKVFDITHFSGPLRTVIVLLVLSNVGVEDVSTPYSFSTIPEVLVHLSHPKRLHHVHNILLLG